MGEKDERKGGKAWLFKRQFDRVFLLRVPVNSREEQDAILGLPPEERRARLLGEGKEDV